MARAHLYRRASTQTQASRQTHRQLAQPIQRTARHTRLPHQAQAAPGATAMTSRVKSSKKSSTIKSAPSHNQTLSARLHVSTNLQQLPHHHPAQQVSPRLSPSAKSIITLQDPRRQPSWRRDRAISSSRRRWALLALDLLRRTRLICLLLH
jgi:hypothetical protein